MNGSDQFTITCKTPVCGEMVTGTTADVVNFLAYHNGKHSKKEEPER